MRFITIVFILFLAAIAFPVMGLADDVQTTEGQTTVIFSEIFWTGSSISSSDEWIELYNFGDAIIDLAGWSIVDLTKPDQSPINIADGQVAPKGFFLIANNQKDHLFSKGESVLAIDPDVVNSNLSLSNSSFQIILVDSDGDLIDWAGDGKKPFWGSTTGFSSMVRNIHYITDGRENNSWYKNNESLNLDLGIQDLATPRHSGRPSIVSVECKLYWRDNDDRKQVSFKVHDPDGDDDIASVSLEISSRFLVANNIGVAGDVEAGDLSWSFVIDRPSIMGELFLGNVKATDKSGLSINQSVFCNHFQLSDRLQLNEIYPDPANGDEEFVEIINSGTTPIDLFGYTVDDYPQGGSKPFTFVNSLVINPGEIKTFSQGKTGITFNNDGDKVVLSDPLNRAIDQIEYQKLNKGQSWSRFIAGWLVTVPTLNNLNLEPVSEQPSVVNKAADEYLNTEMSSIATRDVAGGQKVKVRGIVSVPLDLYEKRNLIIANGLYSVEVQLPEDAVFEAVKGSLLEVRGEISRAQNPRILVKSIADVTVTDKSQNFIVDVNLVANYQSMLFQLVKIKGRISKKDRNTFLASTSLEFKITHKQGFSLDFDEGDEVGVVGLITSLSPLNAMVLSANDVLEVKKLINYEVSHPKESVSLSNIVEDLANPGPPITSPNSILVNSSSEPRQKDNFLVKYAQAIGDIDDQIKNANQFSNELEISADRPSLNLNYKPIGVLGIFIAIGIAIQLWNYLTTSPPKNS